MGALWPSAKGLGFTTEGWGPLCVGSLPAVGYCHLQKALFALEHLTLFCLVSILITILCSLVFCMNAF